MNRRTVLVGSLGIASGLAGCSGILGDSDGEEGDEEAIVEPVRSYVDLAGEGKREEASAYLHPDGTWAESEAEISALLDHNNTTLEDAEVVDRSDDRATLEITLRDHPESDSSTTYSQTVQVRKHEGEWLVYGVPDDRSEALSRPPQTQIETEERTGDDGRTTAVTFQHYGGETIDVATLRVTVGDEVVGPQTDGSMQTGDVAVAPFSAGEDGYAAGTTVALRWHSPSNDVTATIAEHDLETETAGELGTTLEIE